MNRFLYGLLLFLWSEAVAQSSFTALKAGGTGNESGYAVATDASGNVYVTGYFTGAATFGTTTLTVSGNQSYGVFVWKLNSSGVHQWVKKADCSWGGAIDGENFSRSYAIAVDVFGNVYVTSYFWGSAFFGTTTLTSSGGTDIFVWKLNGSGVHQWVKKAGGAEHRPGSFSGIGIYDRSYAIAVDDSGNIYVTGGFTGKAGFGSTLPQDSLTSNGHEDIFVWKLNNSGIYQWVKKAGGTSFVTNIGYGIALDASGNVYVTGFFQGKAGFGSTLSKDSLTSSGGGDIFVWMLNNSGTYQWVKKGGGTGGDGGDAIALDASGNIYVTGFFKGKAGFGSTLSKDSLTSRSDDIFVWKLNSSGTYQWAKKAGGMGDDYSEGIAVDASDNIYVTGGFAGKAGFGSTLPQDSLTSSGEQDIFVWKLNHNGAYQWARKAGGVENDYGYGIAVDGSSNVYVTGYFYSKATFGGTSLTSSGYGDIFVWRALPPMPALTGITLSTTLVAHGTASNTEVATLSASHVDLDNNPTITYAIKDYNAATDTFKIDGNQLKTNKAIDYGILGASHSPITIVARHTPAGGSALTYEKAFTIAIGAPAFTGIGLYGNQVQANASVDTKIGVLKASGERLPAKGKGILFSITGGNTAGYFKIRNDSVLAVAKALRVGSYSLTFSASYLGITTSASRVVRVIAMPEIIGVTLSHSSVAHGTVANSVVGTLTANHRGLGDSPTLIYSLKNANPATDTFKIEGYALKVNKAIEYGVLGAAHSPIAIVVRHTLQGGSVLTYEKPFTIAIRPPRLTSISFTGTRQILDNLSVDTKLGILRATGTHLPPKGKGIVFSITGGNEAGYFKIVEDSVLKVAKRLLAGIYDLQFRAVYAGISYEKAFAISITKPPNTLLMSPRPTFNIYPNPTKNKVRIVGLKEGDCIRLLNATGEVLIQDLHPIVPLNLSHLPTGIYILEVMRPHYLSLRYKLLKRP